MKLCRVMGLGAVAAFAGVGACADRSLTQAPAAAAAAPQAHYGRFVWQDLVTHDAAACRRFYTGLLGWKFQDTKRRGRPYAIASLGNEPIAGIVEATRDEVKRAGWLSYISVADLDRSVEHAKAAGGSVLLGPVPVDPYGRAAVINDPQGAPIGFVVLAQSPPSEPAQPMTGHFFWREYLAKDAAGGLSFYKSLGGYESAVSERQGRLEYHVLRGQRARAGLFQIPDDVKDIEPNWLPYVKVEDPAALAARTASLGGRVLITPGPNFRHGTLAVVADPTGGVLALQKWPIQGAEERR